MQTNVSHARLGILREPAQRPARRFEVEIGIANTDRRSK